LNQLQRVTHPDTEQLSWEGGFTMLSRQQTAVIWDAIRALPPTARRHEVRHAFDLVLLNLRQDTGEVMLTRDEFAEKMAVSPQNVSRVMTTLVNMGVITRQRVTIDGMSGPGRVVFFINPHVAWNGRLEIRKREADASAKPTSKAAKPAAPDVDQVLMAADPAYMPRRKLPVAVPEAAVHRILGHGKPPTIPHHRSAKAKR